MVSIRKATINDAKELLRVKVSAFEWDLETYGMGPPDYDSLDDLIYSIQKALYYKIMYLDRIVGGFSLYKKSNTHFELGSIYIDPSYQNKGIGTKVVELIEKSYPEIKKWTLDTPYLSYRNHGFYEKMGYVKVGETKLQEYDNFILYNFEKNKY